MLWTLYMLACGPVDTAPLLDDGDGDGVGADLDCDDANPDVRPGLPELCNGVDDDCDRSIDEVAADGLMWHNDGDRDGFGDPDGAVFACDPPLGFVADSSDCDDSNGAAFPGAPEDCGPDDLDCDGDAVADAADGTLWFVDADQDGFGGDGGFTACEKPMGGASVGGDCNDEDNSIFPGAVEQCNDVDDDCDAATDDDDGPYALDWYYDIDDDGYGAGEPLRACEALLFTAPVGGDCDDASITIHPNQPEACDGGIDGDCDPLTVDDDAPEALVWFLDEDGDTYGDPLRDRAACLAPEDHVADATDCDDDSPLVHPGAEELCNDADDDCDLIIDEDAAVRDWFNDADGDGFGDPLDIVESCVAPLSYVGNGLDCDDGLADVNPAVDEACDGIDTDCDPSTPDDDAPDAPLWPADSDEDGFGDPVERVQACLLPEGAAIDATDCNDSDSAVFPGAIELCDDIDGDCGVLDEPTLTFWGDADDDGYGDIDAPVEACLAPVDHVADSSDCNDAEASIHPSAEESCNGGVDDDCDPATLDVFHDWWQDIDGDGHGDLTAPTFSCLRPDGYVDVWDDCDIFDPEAYPGAPEDCTGGNDCVDATVVECRFGADVLASDSVGGVEGSNLGDELGAAFDAADLDGDGDVELWVGAPGRDSGSLNTGAFYLYADATQSVARDDFLAARTGVVTDTFIGRAVHLPGDIDGDGTADALGGAPSLGVGGSAMVFLGPLTGSMAATVAETTLTGSEVGAEAGSSFASADAAGDGVSSWLVGAPFAAGVEAGSGAAYLLGTPPAGPSDIVAAAVATLWGVAAGDQSGLTVALADLDGDGTEDAMVSGTASRTSLVYGPVSGSFSLEDADAVWFGADDLAGAALSAGADLDDDGLVDVLLGAPIALSGAGAVYGVSGVASGEVDLLTAPFRIEGSGSGGLGTSVDAADVDGDAWADVLTGAPLGTVHDAKLVYGPLGGVISDAGAISFLGDEVDEGVGVAVRLVDVDGDSLADVIVSAPHWDFFGFVSAGAVTTFSGLP